MNRTAEVFIGIGHPHRFAIEGNRLWQDLSNRLGGTIAGIPVQFGGITQGNTHSLMRVVLSLPEVLKYPPDDCEVINALGKALRTTKTFGAPTNWTLGGWECWYTGMKYNPMEFGR